MKIKVIEIKCGNFEECTDRCMFVGTLTGMINIPGDEVRCISNKETALVWTGE